MSGRGKTGEKGHAKATAHSFRASVQFHVGRIHQLLHKGHYAERVRAGAPVYLAADLKYMTAEIFQLASNAAWGRDSKETRLPSTMNEEPNKILEGVTIVQGGALPASKLCCYPRKLGTPAKFMPEGDPFISLSS
ncbi:histone H2A-like [Carcharodon carcharias]|uniref:histone H2A-like n=1 Tax=Carcharodon carcharias TaxID=13397 RepID=UPI001B7DCDC5|nr:histone H2A-like [Carcharodon carcharias]